MSFSPLALLAMRLCPMIVSLQVLLGLLTVMSMVGLVEVVAHTAIGALLLAIQWLAFLGLKYPFRSETNAESRVSFQETVRQTN